MTSTPSPRITLPPPKSSAPLAPAPYGKACAGCVRAKCKCFQRYDTSECERCHRLGKTCEPSATTRKRKADAVEAHAHAWPQASPPPPPDQSRLEEKLDDLVSLLRSQAAARTPRTSQPQPRAQYQPDLDRISAAPGTSSTDSPISSSSSSSAAAAATASTTATTACDPDLVIDMNPSVIHLLRPAETATSSSASASIILKDVAAHSVPLATADVNLATFRQAFVSTFPMVHIPHGVSAAELWAQRPFLWLVIMALTTKKVSLQFAMEETIWKVISKRIVAEQHASLDLLLGVVCFASWSHYFKQDKPFMTMLSQVSVSLAFELGLQKDVPGAGARQTGARRPTQLHFQAPCSSSSSPQKPHQVRTLEERRAILAVFHLTSSTWTAYRKTEPLRWTPYLDACLAVLSEGQETNMDILLAMQIKCQIITNSLTCLARSEAFHHQDERAGVPSTGLITAMLGRLNDLRQSLPPATLAERTAEFYLCSTETTILESFLSQPHSHQTDYTGTTHFRRLQDLQSILASAERWLALLLEMPLPYWPGVTVDIFSQFLHSLVVLLRLATHDEPGWDRDEVHRRADVLDILDRTCERMDRVPRELGMVDAEGGRSGLFFKTTYLLRAIQSLFAAELRRAAGSAKAEEAGMQSSDPHPPSSHSSAVFGVEPGVVGVGEVGGMGQASNEVDVAFDLSNEPWWLTDLLNMGPSWNSAPEELMFTPYAEY